MLDRFLQLDGQLLVAIQGLHVAWLDPVVSFYTKMGDAGILFIALSLAMLLYRPTRKAGALALGAMVLGLLVTNVTIKPLVERARPWLDWPIIPLDVASLRPHLRRLCRRPVLGQSPALAVGSGCRRDRGGVHGAVPAVCGGPLPHRRAGGGRNRRAVRLGGLEGISNL